MVKNKGKDRKWVKKVKKGCELGKNGSGGA
jgi:hypothetical protein